MKWLILGIYTNEITDQAKWAKMAIMNIARFNNFETLNKIYQYFFWDTYDRHLSQCGQVQFRQNDCWVRKGDLGHGTQVGRDFYIFFNRFFLFSWGNDCLKLSLFNILRISSICIVICCIISLSLSDFSAGRSCPTPTVWAREARRILQSRLSLCSLGFLTLHSILSSCQDSLSIVISLHDMISFDL